MKLKEFSLTPFLSKVIPEHVLKYQALILDSNGNWKHPGGGSLNDPCIEQPCYDLPGEWPSQSGGLYGAPLQD